MVKKKLANVNNHWRTIKCSLLLNTEVGMHLKVNKKGCLQSNRNQSQKKKYSHTRMDRKIRRCQGNKKYLCAKLNIIFTDNYQSSTKKIIMHWFVHWYRNNKLTVLLIQSYNCIFNSTGIYGLELPVLCCILRVC